MNTVNTRKGFTLVELLIVIVVIGVLAAMMMFSSTEAVTTSKASNIIANLTTFKKATLAWYMDNLEKIQADGRVKVGNKIQPIQQWKDSQIHISDYIGNVNAFTFNANDSKNTSGQNTKLNPGCYGIYDAGEPRTIWYVGYYFKPGEEAVRDKVKGRAKSLGLIFTDEGDPFDQIKIIRDNKGKKEEELRLNGEHAVWLRVL